MGIADRLLLAARVLAIAGQLGFPRGTARRSPVVAVAALGL
ncbi:MAG: hypothetical protein U1F30_16785 [Steroidobacteraceae bacterium]